MTRRDVQRDATRVAILDAAVGTLVELGLAGTSTVEVQRRAGISRGALLHHFGTREQLLAAAIERLVAANHAAVLAELDHRPIGVPGEDRLLRGLRVLRAVVARPAFAAELELWAAARTNKDLALLLRRAEGAARRDLDVMVAEVFGPQITGAPGYGLVLELTIPLLRGLAVAGPLDRGPDAALLERWAAVARPLLTEPPPERTSARDARHP